MCPLPSGSPIPGTWETYCSPGSLPNSQLRVNKESRGSQPPVLTNLGVNSPVQERAAAVLAGHIDVWALEDNPSAGSQGQTEPMKLGATVVQEEG